MAAEVRVPVDEGSGPPLVVFHGWSGSSHNVLRWLPALTPDFRVVVPDLPGCNGSPPLAVAHSADAYARLQLAILASPAGALFGPVRRNTLLATLHRRLFANAAEVDAPQLAHDQDDLLRADVRAGRELARDLARIDRTATLRDWRGPLAVLLAEHDAFVDAGATAALVARAAPHARIELIPGGHGWTPAFIAAQHEALGRLGPALLAAAR